MLNIIYPTRKKSKLRIGVMAPSSGLGSDVFIQRFELLKKQFENSGVEIVEGQCLRNNNKYVSGAKKDRATDFMKLWKNPSVDLIFPPWGGEILLRFLS